MNLNNLLEGIDVLSASGEFSGDVAGLCYDSRDCRENWMFVAVRGFAADGHQYISDAINHGARYIVYDSDIPDNFNNVTFIKVADSRSVLGRLGKNFYNDPSSSLCLIGITGTNGKTTTTFFLESILRAAGFNVGVLGTINYRYGKVVMQASHTTPESLDVQKILREMVEAGVTHVVMEVSSHAIDLDRISECNFVVGIFTNLSQEHLDYHHTMEEYFSVKKKFFLKTIKGKTAIINIDDCWGKRLIKEISSPVIPYSLHEESDCFVNSFNMSTEGIQAQISAFGRLLSVSSSMIGKINGYNILASVAAAISLDISFQCIQRGIKAVTSVPGRLERVRFAGKGEPAVFVDYAHTGDALEKVLTTLVDFKNGKKIITVFGCGGDRDRTKRPVMGKTATDLSDITVITSDNPRTEDPMKIIAEIERGIDQEVIQKYASSNMIFQPGVRGYFVIPDRKSAIEKAIALAGSEDIVLIAGKGHEDYQIIGNKRVAFDDRTVVRKILEKRRSWRIS